MTEHGGKPDEPRDRDGLEQTRFLPPIDWSEPQRGESGWAAPGPQWQSGGQHWQPQGQPEARPEYGQPAFGPGYGDYGQPQYGQYGQPQNGQYGYPGTATVAQPAPPKRSHALLWVALALLVVAAALVAAAFVVRPTWLGFKRVFDNNAVAATIVAQSNGQYSVVSCPSNEPATTGTTFQCTANNGSKIDVRVTSDSGDYVWSPAG